MGFWDWFEISVLADRMGADSDEISGFWREIFSAVVVESRGFISGYLYVRRGKYR